MALEVTGALLLAALVFWLVFEPGRRRGGPDLALLEAEAPEETRRGVALLALKEIEFDRETGKLSDADYELLKSRYGAEALAALEAEAPAADAAATGDAETLIAARLHALRSAREAGAPAAPACRACGPRPEPDALFCSRCGLPLGEAAAAFCTRCGAALPEDSRFCAACGCKVAA